MAAVPATSPAPATTDEKKGPSKAQLKKQAKMAALAAQKEKKAAEKAAKEVRGKQIYHSRVTLCFYRCGCNA
jgi:cytochrome c5